MPRPHNPCQQMGGAAQAPPLMAFPLQLLSPGPPGRAARQNGLPGSTNTRLARCRRRHALADIVLAKLTQLGGQHKLGAAGLPPASGAGLAAEL